VSGFCDYCGAPYEGRTCGHPGKIRRGRPRKGIFTRQEVLSMEIKEDRIQRRLRDEARHLRIYRTSGAFAFMVPAPVLRNLTSWDQLRKDCGGQPDQKAAA
jgi:hypothetical protein